MNGEDVVFYIAFDNI